MYVNLSNIKTIFFDLDNTLFDHTRAESSALRILLDSLPDFDTIDREAFIRIYDKNNQLLWRKMENGEITPDELKVSRFQKCLDEFDIDIADVTKLSKLYLQIYSTQNYVFPNAIEVLEYLKPKYTLGVLSNGFAEIQQNKLKTLNLQPYFEYEIYSGDVGAMKPAREIFLEATKAAKVRAEQIVYVGDSYEHDVKGAKAANWHTIFFNPRKLLINDGVAYAEISDLLQLKDIL